MGWWGNKSNHAVLICYRCRTRISREELAQGLHDHDQESPEPVASPMDYARRYRDDWNDPAAAEPFSL